MRIAIVLLIFAACDQGEKKPSHAAEAKAEPATEELIPSKAAWQLLEARGQPLSPPGPVDKMAAALAKVTGDDIPEAAIEDLFAWAEAQGSLPWRSDHSIGAIITAKLHAFKIGEAALARRATDARTPGAVLYLAQRFRTEGGCMIDTNVGFELAAKVRKVFPDAKGLAPTEAELQRGLALEALCGRWLLDNDWVSFMSYRDQARRGVIGDATLKKAASGTRSEAAERAHALVALQELALTAPEDRTKLADHVRAMIKKHESSWAALIVISSSLPRIIDTTNEYFDAAK